MLQRLYLTGIFRIIMMENKSKISRMNRMNRIKPKCFFADSAKNLEEFEGFQVNTKT
jgi:hypothetical protein